MFLVSTLVSIYYNMVIAWAFFYTFASFASDVPWKTCQNEWNTAGMLLLRLLSVRLLLAFSQHQLICTYRSTLESVLSTSIRADFAIFYS